MSPENVNVPGEDWLHGKQNMEKDRGKATECYTKVWEV